MTDDFINQNVTVYAFSQSGNKESYGTGTTIEAMIQPLEIDDALASTGEFTRSYKMYVGNDVSIKKSDKVSYNDKDYVVKVVNDYEKYPVVEELLHKKVIIERVE